MSFFVVTPASFWRFWTYEHTLKIAAFPSKGNGSMLKRAGISNSNPVRNYHTKSIKPTILCYVRRIPVSGGMQLVSLKTHFIYAGSTCRYKS
jgi:hypothetical protein